MGHENLPDHIGTREVSKVVKIADQVHQVLCNAEARAHHDSVKKPVPSAAYLLLGKDVEQHNEGALRDLFPKGRYDHCVEIRLRTH